MFEALDKFMKADSTGIAYEKAEIRALASDTATKAKLIEAEKQNASWAAQASHAAG